MQGGPTPGEVLGASCLVLHCSLLGRRALPGSRAVASDWLRWEFVGALCQVMRHEKTFESQGMQTPAWGAGLGGLAPCRCPAVLPQQP